MNIRKFLEAEKAKRRKALYKWWELPLYCWHLLGGGVSRWPSTYDPYRQGSDLQVVEASPVKQLLEELRVTGPTKARLQWLLETELRKRVGW